MIIRGKMLVSTTPYTDGDDCDVTMSPDAARCAELAALEREIGRAVIACRDTESVMQGYESRISLNDAEVVDYRAAEKRIIQQETALDALIARWRQLHAGAEGER